MNNLLHALQAFNSGTSGCVVALAAEQRNFANYSSCCISFAHNNLVSYYSTEFLLHSNIGLQDIYTYDNSAVVEYNKSPALSYESGGNPHSGFVPIILPFQNSEVVVHNTAQRVQSCGTAGTRDPNTTTKRFDSQRVSVRAQVPQLVLQNDKMSNFGVVSTISAPVLKSVTHSALIQFQTDYKAYTEKVADINRNRNEDNKIEAASIRNCFEPILLSSLCLLGQIEGASTAEAASDADCQEDPAGAALTFIINTVKALKRNNASDVIKEPEKCKSLIGKLIHKLDPPELKERIKCAYECWSKEEKSSLTFFQERISTVAVDVAQGEVARSRIKRKQNHRRTDDSTKKTTEIIVKKLFRKRGKVASDKLEDKCVKKKFKYKCLNTLCDEHHLLKYCKNTAEEYNKELLDEFYKNKKAAKSLTQTPRCGTTAPTEPHVDNGRFKSLLDDKLK
eukprot:IDg4521t1